MGRGPEEEMGSGTNCLVLLPHTGLGTSIWTLRRRPSTWKLKEMFYDKHGETLVSSALSRSSGDRGGGVGIWPILCRDITHMALIRWRDCGHPATPDGLCGTFEVLCEQVREEPGKRNSFLEPRLYPQNSEAGKLQCPVHQNLSIKQLCDYIVFQQIII